MLSWLRTPLLGLILQFGSMQYDCGETTGSSFLTR